MRGGTKVMPPIFFSETIITIIMKFMHNMGTSFKNLRLFFHKFFLIFNKLFPLCEMLYEGRIKLFAEVLELITYTVFQLVVVCKTASSDCTLQGAKKMEFRRC
jgi:hypothetical protein